MTFRAALAFTFLCAATVPASSEVDVAGLAQEAARQLGEAAEALSEAEKAPDRIEALTRTIRAYEAGLSAMREGLRRAALDERALAERLTDQDEAIGELLVLLERVSKAGQVEAALHPGSAPETVRAGILAASMVPALEERSQALEADLANLSALRTVREGGVTVLQHGLAEVRQARLTLSQAISERTDLPPLIATDEAAMEALINSSETLAAFADSLAGDDVAPPDGESEWRMPVLGQVVRRFDEADPAGVRRPGWTIAAETQALVTAPAEATIRFSGEVPGSGPVVILEPDPGRLLILVGLGKSFVRNGQIVSAGEPVGLMGGATVTTQEKLNETSLLGGQSREETLYIEIRQGQTPVDPSAYLRPSEE